MIDQLAIGIILGTAFVFLLLLVVIMTLHFILTPTDSLSCEWHIWYAWYPVKINGKWAWRRLIERRGRCYRELGEMK